MRVSADMRAGEDQLRVLIAGGGVAAVETLLALDALAGGRVATVLLAPELHLTYRPRAVLEPFRLGERRRYSLARIGSSHGAIQRRQALAEVDAADHRVRTDRGQEIAYDVLLIAVGAASAPVFPEAITFSDDDPEAFVALIEEIRTGSVHRVAFVVPPGVAWALPLYELALMTALEAGRHESADLALALITPEEAPLGLFGARASEAVAALLDDRAIEVRTGAFVERVVDGRLIVRPGGERLGFDRVVSLPRPVGPRIGGLPHDSDGFICVDQHSRVLGVDDVYAAGDVTAFPIKQGGLAAQQADAAAEMIAARAGVHLEPREFRPVLRGVLVTRAEPKHLRAAISGGQGETSIASSHALWWPSAKIAGRYLAPLLARLDAAAHSALGPDAPGAISVDVELRDLSSP
jgi:sulfide:quinone oxidoreductase